jgi:hypothetical protein
LGDFVAEEDVFGDRQERHERQFLVNDDDSDFFGVLECLEMTDVAFVDNVAIIGSSRVNA